VKKAGEKGSVGFPNNVPVRLLGLGPGFPGRGVWGVSIVQGFSNNVPVRLLGPGFPGRGVWGVSIVQGFSKNVPLRLLEVGFPDREVCRAVLLAEGPGEFPLDMVFQTMSL
jgi:hypothetical protein